MPPVIVVGMEAADNCMAAVGFVHSVDNCLAAKPLQMGLMAVAQCYLSMIPSFVLVGQLHLLIFLCHVVGTFFGLLSTNDFLYRCLIDLATA